MDRMFQEPTIRAQNSHAAVLRRTTQLETAAELARVTGSRNELSDLLTTAAHFLRERLDLAFVGLFLLDEFKRNAVLRASAGEPGQTLLQQGYQLSLADDSPVTQALSADHPIFTQHGINADQPYGGSLLPHTEGAAVIPLKARRGMLGVWTAHTNVVNALGHEDADVLALIGDNLAFAIENAELSARFNAGSGGTDLARRDSARSGWATDEAMSRVVYSRQADAFDLGDADGEGQTLVAPKGDGAVGAMSVPITLRGQVIGTVDLFDVTQPRHWDDNEKALVSGVVEQLALAVENARLYQETEQRARETQIINEMAAAISGELDAHRLFETVYHYLPRLMPTDAFMVWLYDDQTHQVTRPVLYDLGEFFPDEEGPRDPSGSVARVVESRSPVVLNSTRQEWEQERQKTQLILGSSEPSASLLYVPLRVGNRMRGILSVQTYEFDAYGSPQMALLINVANTVATALENAQLFAETNTLFNQAQQALAETRLLYSTSGQLNQVTSLEELVRIAAQPAFAQGAGSSQLLLMDYQGKETPVAANVVVSLVSPGVPAPLSQYTHFAIDQYTLGQTMLANPRELVIVEDVAASPLLDESTRDVLIQSNDRAVVLMPLSVEQHVLGAIAIGWAAPHRFTDRERRIYQSLAGQLALVLNNRLLFEQTEQALAETQTLYEISARLNAANSLQESLEAASGPAIVQGASTASLFRVLDEPDGQINSLQPVAVWPRNSEHVLGIGERVGCYEIAGDQVWLENPHEPVLVENVHEDERVSPAARRGYRQKNVIATALLPLKLGDRWIGVLTFDWQTPHTFTSRDLRLFRSIMAQAATVLDNSALFEQTQNALAQTQAALDQAQQVRDRLNLQYQTASLLASAASFDSVAKSILELTCRTLDWQVGEYWVINETLNRLIQSEIWSASDSLLENFAAATHELSFARGVGLAGRAWGENKPIWVEDVDHDPGFMVTGRAHQAGLVSALAFPLSSETREFGAMVFFSKRPLVMDETLMATTIGVGGQIGQYMERRRADEAIHQQNTYLTALHDTTLGLMRRLNLDELLQNIITRAGELVGTEHGYVHLIEPNGAELRMRIGIGIYQDFVGTIVKPGQGLAGTVWSNQEAIVVDDYRRWPGRLPMVDRDVLRAVAGVPLKSGSQTVGVLGLASLEEGRRFGAAQIEALNRFAELAAVALDNAQLYDATQNALQQTQRVAQREKASSEIADKMYAAPDVKTVLRTAAEELRKSTGSRRAIVRLNLGANPAAPPENGMREPNGNANDHQVED